MLGLPVAGVLYYVFTRSVDVEAETRVAEAEAAELEATASEHHLPQSETGLPEPGMP